MKAIVESGAEGQTVRMPTAKLQPIVSDDVAAALAEVAVGDPVNGMVELAGPEAITIDELARQYLAAHQDSRVVVADPQALYFGSALDDQTLTPGENPRLGKTRFAEWLSRSR